MNLGGKRLVFIGGAGLIGAHTVAHLVREDVKEIVIYDNFLDGLQASILLVKSP